jgi:hypothetical protein
MGVGVQYLFFILALYGYKLRTFCSVLFISIKIAHSRPTNCIAEWTGTEAGLEVFRNFSRWNLQELNHCHSPLEYIKGLVRVSVTLRRQSVSQSVRMSWCGVTCDKSCGLEVVVLSLWGPSLTRGRVCPL